MINYEELFFDILKYPKNKIELTEKYKNLDLEKVKAISEQTLIQPNEIVIAKYGEAEMVECFSKTWVECYYS